MTASKPKRRKTNLCSPSTWRIHRQYHSSIAAIAATFFFLATCLFVSASIGAEVTVNASTRKGYVGLPIPVRITIKDSSYHDPPTIKPVDGLTIRSAGSPSSSRRTSTFRDGNGVRTISVSTLTYTFLVTPQRPGKFTIPPIRVNADGASTVTEAVTIEAEASETGDLLAVEIDAEQSSAYVGERLMLTLTIFVKPFRDEERGITLGRSAMWQCIRTGSDWGVFSERIKQLRDERLLPPGKEVLRTDDSGDPAAYYSYEIEATIDPKRPGEIAGDPVRVTMHYPVQLSAARDPFGRVVDDRMLRGMFGGSFFTPRAEITEKRPVTAEATFQRIEVKPIPTVGRPDDYQGAVGQFRIATDASPTTCEVGDPIRLTVFIDGNGPMEGIRPPNIAQNAELTKNFRVLDEPLSGYVDDQRKVFWATIRPKHDQVQSVPSIRYSYFDPKAEEFVTVESKPITIRVDKTDVIALEGVASGAAVAQSGSDLDDHDDATPVAATTFDADQMLTTQPSAERFSRGTICLLVIPPLIALLSQLIFHRAGINSFIRRFVPADRELLRNLDHAKDRAGIAVAFERYLSRLTGKSERLSAIGALRAVGNSRGAVLAERIYSRCATTDPHTSHDRASIESLKRDLRDAVEVIQTAPSQLRRMESPSLTRPTRNTIGLIGTFMMASAFSSTLMAQDTLALSRDQASVLLEDAHSLLQQAESLAAKERNNHERRPTRRSGTSGLEAEFDDNALGTATDDALSAAALGDSSGAADKFSQAAATLRVLTDSGIDSAPLHYQIGLAYARAGQRGRAIASFRRALRLDPTHHASRQALFAEQRPEPNRAGVGSGMIAGLFRWLHMAREKTTSTVPLNMIAWVFGASWIALWLLLALRWAGFARSIWLYAGSATVLSLAAGWVYDTTMDESTRTDVAVLVANRVELRDSDDSSRPALTTLEDADGTVVKEIGRREGWVQIETPRGAGWVVESAVESVSS